MQLIIDLFFKVHESLIISNASIKLCKMISLSIIT